MNYPEFCLAEYTLHAANARYSHRLAVIAYAWGNDHDAKQHQCDAAHSAAVAMSWRNQYQYCMEVISR